MTERPKPDADHAALEEQALALLVRLHSGAASPQAQRDWQDWQSRGPAELRAARAAEALWQEVGGLRRDPPRRPLSRRGVITGFAGLAMGGAGYGAWQTANGRVAGQLATGTAQTMTDRLPDGSRYALDAKSGFDPAFTPDRRQLTLRQGTIWLEVSADPRPFLLAAGGHRLTLNPGEANIALGPTGALRLDLYGGAQIAGSARSLAPNSHVLLAPDTDIPQGEAPAVPMAEASAWRRGLLVSHDLTLGEIITRLDAWYHGYIRLADPALADMQVAAVLNLKDPPAALATLAEGLPIRISNYAGMVISVHAA